MSTPQETDARYKRLIDLVRLARGLEAGGYNNAAKLFWAMVLAEEIQAANEHPVTAGAGELQRELELAIAALAESGRHPELIAALRHGQQGVREDRTIPYTQIPAVHVCRTCGHIILGERPESCPNCRAHGLTMHTVPPIYWLEFLSPDEVLAALATAPDEIQGMLDGLSDEQLARPPQPGEWSVQQVLWHLLVAQGLLEQRVARMLAEDGPALQSVAAWAVEGDSVLGAAGLLERYRGSREQVVRELRAMPSEGWWRTGWHEEWGPVTILSQATYFARHERSHWAQLLAARPLPDAATGGAEGLPPAKP